MLTNKKLDTFIDVKSIMVVGRRWFEKTNGNTYHTAEIYVNNDFVHKIDFTYGYGEQYYWNSWDWLVKNGYIKSSRFENPRIYCEKNKIKLNHTVSDVKRKKDL